MCIYIKALGTRSSNLRVSSTRKTYRLGGFGPSPRSQVIKKFDRRETKHFFFSESEEIRERNARRRRKCRVRELAERSGAILNAARAHVCTDGTRDSGGREEESRSDRSSASLCWIFLFGASKIKARHQKIAYAVIGERGNDDRKARLVHR